MAQSVELKASVRGGVGKGAARAVRRENKVPGVVYGDAQAPEAVSLNFKELVLQYQKGNFLSTVLDLDIEGRKLRVIPRDIQLDPVRDFPLHVDFMRLGKGARIRVRVPVIFANQDKSPGIKRGGVLNVVRHDIEVYCPAEAIPESIVASIEGMEIGQSLHISAVTLPANVRTVIQNRDFTVATIAGAKAEEEAPAAEAAAAATPAAAEGDAKAAEAAAGDDKDKAKK
jgi:large subunit ribosomal protein L25